MPKILAFTLLGLLFFFASACKNPFAPTLDNNSGSGDVLGDQHYADGVFRNFQYAYTFKDTLIYGKLLAPDFTFIYRDLDRGVDDSWGRDQDMITTSGLFQSAQKLDLVWNEVIVSTTSGDTLSDVSRGFDLTVTFNPGDITRVDGRVSLRLVRKSGNDIWKIKTWRDESTF